MTTQEKINQLALAALEDAPKSSPQAQPAAGPAAQSAPVAKPTAKSEVTPISSSAAGELNTQLREVIEFRDEKMKKRWAKISMALTLTFLTATTSFASWVAFSTKGKQCWTAAMATIEECKGDFQSLGNVLSHYDKQLERIAVQSARVDAASRALGVDPDKAENQGDSMSFNEEMKQMQAQDGAKSEGGPTALERNQNLQQTFGVVSKLAGRDPDKAKEKVESDVKF